MLRNIINFYTSKDSSKTSLKILVSAAVIYACISYYFRYLDKPEYAYVEGFTQNEPFVLKTDDKCYDDFYTQVYDEVYNTNKERFDNMKCFQKYKSYTNSNTVPKFCRELSEIS